MNSGKLLREKIREGKFLVGPFMKTLDEGIVETAGYSGYDFVILDQEHGPANWETLGRLIRAAKIGGVASIVRIPYVSEETVSKPLDLGADGIQLPNVSNAEDVRKLIKFARFSPKGSRGVCRFVRAAKYSALDRKEYFKEANESFLVIQIEGQEGLRNINEILKEDGYDVLFIGPYDLSQSLGKIGQIDAPEVIDAIKGILQKAKASGKELGIFADTIESAIRWRDLGVRYISYSVDMGLFYEKCREVNQSIRTVESRSSLTIKEYLICTPGPVQMSKNVQQALCRPLIPHYGNEWVETVYDKVLKDLHTLFQTKNDIFTIPSSGSGAVESAFCSLSSKDRKVAIFRNGFFGERMLNMARAYFPEVLDCQIPPSQTVTAKLVEDFLLQHPEVDVVGIVHGETSTGVANDIKEIGKIVKKKERIFIVDAVSTLGAMDVKVDEWNIDLCLTASQKGISASPGLAFVSVSELGYRFMPERAAIPGWYHNLRVWKDSIEEWGAWHPYPVTLPVNLFYALKIALEEILDEGLTECFARHKRVAGYFRKNIQKSGLSLFCASPGFETDTMTSFLLPDGYKSPDLLKFLKSEYNIIIAGGTGKFKDKMSRVGHMGYNAREEVMDKVLEGINAFLKVKI